MIRKNGWKRFNIWEHSRSVGELYTSRARDEAPEMTSAAQAAELVAPIAGPGDSLLDVGCGAGHLYHSLRRRSIPVEYFGIDATDLFVQIGRRELSRFGLPKERLQCLRIEDAAGAFDHVVCLNVLSNIDNFHRPLERMLRMARKSVVLRESMKHGSEYLYVRDKYLDPDCDLWVHVNAYDIEEVCAFVRTRGFDAALVVDRHTGGKPELVIDWPHYWTFLVARRGDAPEQEATQ